MRICYIVQSRNHFASTFVDYFARRGHEIHLISFTPEPLSNAVNHHPLAHDGQSAGKVLAYVGAIPAVRRMVRRIAPDLVHAHFLTSNGLVAAMTGFHPLVVSAHGSDVHRSMARPLRRKLIQFVMRRADLVHTVSRDLAINVASLGVPTEKTVALSQGVEVARFAEPRARRTDGLVHIICTRTLQSPYQPHTIVEALHQLAGAGVSFRMTFAARGRDEEAVRRHVGERGLADRVDFLGGYDLEALPRLLAGADVYVSAALWDGTSLSLLEAMAAGAFPVVTDCPANREWLAERDAGLFFPAEDADTLAQRLATAVASPELRDAAAERNRRKVAEDGDRERNLGLLADYYERLVGKREEGGVIAAARRNPDRDRGSTREGRAARAHGAATEGGRP